MTFSAEITKQLSDNLDNGAQPSSVRILITVDSVVGFNDVGLFVNQVDPVTLLQVYSHVATPYDLTQYYLDNPAGQDFVRSGTLDIIQPTATDAEACIAAIEVAIKLLTIDMCALQQLNDPVTLTISTDC